MSKLAEKLFVVAMLFYTTGALLPIVIARLHGYSGLSGNTIELAIQTVFYAAALCFIVPQWRNVLQGAGQVKWILALLAVAFASTAWSQDPLITLRRSTILAATTVFAIYFATRFDVPEQLRLAASAFALVVVASFACAILLPQYGIDHTIHYGDWQGAFYQKNMLARAMVLAMCVFLSVRFKSLGGLRWGALAAALTLIALSRSVTGLIVFVIIAGSLPMYRLLRARFTFLVPVALVIFCLLATGATLAYANLPNILDMMGRNEGLTGRTDLWEAVVLSISERPWIGYGYDAFWQGMTGESAKILLAVGWAPAYAHNGFLDLALELGLLGLAVFSIGYFLLWRRAIAHLKQNPGPVAIWLCMYLAFMLLYNLTEGPVVSQNNITWVLYVATAVSLGLYSPAGKGSEQEVSS